MREYIEKIRQHNESRKRLYLWVIMAVCITLLIVVWVVNIGSRVEKINRDIEKHQAPGPGELIKDGITQIVN
ncbi:MAG: hypothetical protein R3B64_02770 [Candidatus Paceibacterota bacterium]